MDSTTKQKLIKIFEYFGKIFKLHAESLYGLDLSDFQNQINDNCQKCFQEMISIVLGDDPVILNYDMLPPSY